MPTVSIVLPTYNGEKYIRQSVDSICGQTYTDWELFIVDDCSEDCTLEIAREYEKNDSRIHVIHNTVNKKLPASLNIGFRHTAGKYLTWTSDDNMYLPEALSVMVQRLKMSDTAMVCADMYFIDETGEIKPGIVSGYRDKELCRYNTVGACFLYRREVLDSVGDYDTGLFYVEDYDYWLRIKQQYGRIERIDRILYKYRYHDDSLTFSKKGNVQSALYKLRKKHLDFILADLKNEKGLLAALYYEMLENRLLDLELKGRIQSVLPELKNDKTGTRGKYMILGAGKYGKMALSLLGDAAVCFADNDPVKTGTCIEGKKIISYEEMLSLTGQYDVMIAVHEDKVYQLIHQLQESGIAGYCTYQTYRSDHSVFHGMEG